MEKHVVAAEQLRVLAARPDIERFFHVETGMPLCAGQVLDQFRATFPDPTVADAVRRMELDVVTRFGEKFVFGDTHSTDWRWETALREIVCEWVRRTSFPDQLSRLGCVFALGSLDEARRYKQRMGIPAAPVWQVGAGGAFRKDLGWLVQKNTLAEIVSSVVSYWAGEESNDPLWELLLSPQVIVFGRVE